MFPLLMRLVKKIVGKVLQSYSVSVKVGQGKTHVGLPLRAVGDGSWRGYRILRMAEGSKGCEQAMNYT